MERLLFRKIELWAVLLVLILAAVAAMLFGGIVRSVAADRSKFGTLGKVAWSIASVPGDIRSVLTEAGGNDQLAVDDQSRFAGQRGWVPGSAAGSPMAGYLLLSRYDGDAGHSVIELTDLATLRVLHRIDLQADAYFEDADRRTTLRPTGHWSTPLFRAIHPIAVDGGDLLIKDHTSPLVRIDACGNRVWMKDGGLFHHASERGADGTIWTSVHLRRSAIAGTAEDFFDDAVVNLSAEGKILYQRSIAEVLLEQGYGHILFGRSPFYRDPMHLNDVQPVLEDGPYWRRGDLFISLRHASAVLLFRPSTDKIVWLRQGPWSGQHDVDILDDHRIGIFNNNMQDRGTGEDVEGTNEILVYDFATDTVSSPYRAWLERANVRTPSEGLFTILPSGHLMVEETDAGRLLFFSPTGELAASHVNRAGDGRIWMQNWSRYLSPAEGAALVAAMRSKGC